jgi:hypothetical protein
MTAAPDRGDLPDVDIEEVQKNFWLLYDYLRREARSAINSSSRASTNSTMLVEDLLCEFRRVQSGGPDSSDWGGFNPKSRCQFLSLARERFRKLLRERKCQEAILETVGIDALADPAGWRVCVDLVRRKKKIEGISPADIEHAIGQLEPQTGELLWKIIIAGRTIRDLREEEQLTDRQTAEIYETIEAGYSNLVKILQNRNQAIESVTAACEADVPAVRDP